ncbi:MAG: extensin family protein [Paracoccaceae bacterium]|nr:MAG: extensin family protein [Paracoccaceae bacterium]
MRFLLALALASCLAPPVLAEGLRPLARPASVERLAAFSHATDLAPRQVMRPRAGPAAMSAPTEPVLPVLAAAPRLSGPSAAPEPIADPARALGATRGLAVTLSASNARAPVFMPVAMAVPRPLLRPAVATAPVAVAPAMPRPHARPSGLAPLESVVPAAFVVVPRMPAAAAAVAALVSPRPAPRPRNLAARAAAPRKAPAPESLIQAAAAPRIDPGKALTVPKKKGALCGDPRIQGAALAPITSRVQGCGIAQPVRVTQVDGVRLSTPATLDCDTARALTQWVATGLKPAAGRAGVAELKIAAHYACRPRNNVKGARISEHGRGRAIDIAGITLANGKPLSVLGDYRRSEVLQKVRRAACGIFGTTLGPGSDRHHSDHFHFDTARHRNGPYCR